MDEENKKYDADKFLRGLQLMVQMSSLFYAACLNAGASPADALELTKVYMTGRTDSIL